MGRLSVVYIAVAGDYVKVGMSTNVEKRMQTLNTGGPLDVRLIWTSREMLIENTRHLESRIHNRLSQYHTKGEWFQCKLPVAIDTAKEVVHDVAMDKISGRNDPNRRLIN